jgi:anti-sigma regulatory factor (Ser/Thr protein kinase)
MEPSSPSGGRATFVADERSIGQARAFVASVIASWGAPNNDDAVLLTSEAVTNAYLHASTTSVVVDVERSGACVRVAVADEDPTHPVVRSAAPDVPGGFGMRLIDSLSERWGIVDHAEDGKTVWFEVELQGTTPPGLIR